MDCFSIDPSENCVPITLYEQVSDDYTIRHQYFMTKEVNNINFKYIHDSSGDKLLEFPISSL